MITCWLGQITDFHPQYDNHVEVLKEKLRLLKTEFEGIKDDLDRLGDKYVLMLVKILVIECNMYFL